MLFCLVAVSIMENSQSVLRLAFRRRYFKNATVKLLASYTLLSIFGYYSIHGQNILADEVWNRKFEASWSTFLPAFNVFYWTFFKYGAMLFLFRQLLLLSRLLIRKERALHAAMFRKTAEPPVCVLGSESELDITKERSVLPLQEKNVKMLLPLQTDVLSVKVGATTYILDIKNIVYLEVQDETTTVYQVDGTYIAIKIALSRFFERLPKDRFVKIHDSRVAALSYIVKEKQGHLYMSGYEEKGLKMGKPERFPDYKQWKENNRLK